MMFQCVVRIVLITTHLLKGGTSHVQRGAWPRTTAMPSTTSHRCVTIQDRAACGEQTKRPRLQELCSWMRQNRLVTNGHKFCHNARHILFPVDCIWAAWSAWGICDSGSGVQDRNRTVDQEALNGGSDCTGNTTETQDCPGRSVFVIDSIIPTYI